MLYRLRVFCNLPVAIPTAVLASRTATTSSTAPSSGKTKSNDNNKAMLKMLRKETGYPLINCKQALQIADYDFEKAKAHLEEIAKQKGLDKLQSARSMQQGLISLAADNNIAVLLEANCETDFVAKTAQFQKIVKNTADMLLEKYNKERSTDASSSKIKVNIPVKKILKMQVSETETVNDKIVMAAGKLRENIQIRRALMFDTTSQPDLYIGSYVHPSMLVQSTRPNAPMGEYIACVVYSVDTSAVKEPVSQRTIKMVGRDLAQHIVGMNPNKIGKSPKKQTVKMEVDDGEGGAKTEQIERRLPVEGSKHLMKQAFLLDSQLSVAEWLQQYNCQVKDFVRFRVAETLEDDK